MVSETTEGVEPEHLEQVARRLRQHIITMTTAAGSGHPTSSLSSVELVSALYFGGFLRFRSGDPGWARRDRFILSKGHAAPLLYAALAEAGYFPVESLTELRKLGSVLEGHPNMLRLPGVEASTGSLGQGLSIGLGHALSVSLDEIDARVYVLLGDGEIGEGQVWEAAAAAAKYRVGNLTAIIDHNGFQQTGRTEEVLDLSPIEDKFKAFGWHASTIDGHNVEAVLEALSDARNYPSQPQAIIATTEKGHGIVPLLKELNDENFHGQVLSAEVAEKALQHIGKAS